MASLVCRTSRPKHEEAAANWGKRLFTKNTGACEVARRCIRSDACPVLEGYEDGLAKAKLRI